MKTNYKAIGLRIKFIREIKEKTLYDVEHFLGEEHKEKQRMYEDGKLLNIEVIQKLSSYFKTCIYPQYVKCNANNIISYGDLSEFSNMFSLHLQYEINRSHLRLSIVCDNLEISRNTLSNWLDGSTLPKEGKIYRLAEFIHSGDSDIKKLINLSE